MKEGNLRNKEKITEVVDIQQSTELKEKPGKSMEELNTLLD